MFVASEEATSGSVIANDERISPWSSGPSHSFRWVSVPNIASTSMFPVSGAEQLRAAGARWPLRPVISASGAYCRLVSPAPCSPGRKRFHRPRRRASARSSASTGTESHAHLSVSCPSCSWNTGSAGYTCLSMKSSRLARSSSVLASNVKSISVLLQGGEAGVEQGVDELPDVLEARADGLAVQVAVVDALDDGGELVRREPEVEPEA